MYDYIIIGGGISGLYMNYLLTKDYKTLLLEKDKILGGRAREKLFHDVKIKLGAGIGALHNKHLLRLLEKLDIKYIRQKAKLNILIPDKIKMNKMISQIKDEYKKHKSNLTSKDFIIKYLGLDFFNTYSKYTEFTDFFDTSIEYYIKYYNGLINS